MGKFVIRKRTNGQFQFDLKADNGITILTSEGYDLLSSCRKGIESVKTNAPNDDRYSRHISANQKYYFNLKAANGEIIGTSEMYESPSGREVGIDSVKRNAPNAAIS